MARGENQTKKWGLLMAAKFKPPKEEQAPAYFAMYSSLWCILLGFFVMLLSLGDTQKGAGVAGVGEVRDAFGTSGGAGLLPFAKNTLFGSGDGKSSSLRIVHAAKADKGVPLDYIRGMLWRKGLEDISMVSVHESLNGQKVTLSLPVSYRGDSYLEADSIRLLKRLGEVIFNFQDYEFEVKVVCTATANAVFDQKTATQRAVVVSRFLKEVAGLPAERLHAVGYSDNRFLARYGIEHVNERVLITISRESGID